MINVKNIVISMSVTVVLALSLPAQADWKEWFSLDRAKEIIQVNNPVYEDECGSCHFAYQPGLLPKASWEKLMDGKALEDHFGDNAELDDAVRAEIERFLVENAADDAASKRSKKIMASLREDLAPIRITKVPFIVSRHEEIPDRLISGNPKVKSLSQCQQCHQDIKNGVYDDDTVYIAGHGYFED